MYANYRAIGGPTGHLARLEPFEGNSMSAQWIGDRYVVFSYSTGIAAWEHGEGYVSDRRYSRTTNRHQGLCRAWLGRQAHWHRPVQQAA